MTWHWRDDGHGPLLVFLAVVIALFGAGWFWAAVNLKPEDTGFRNAGFWWVLFSALLTYGALTAFLNRTVLTATRERLSLRSGPLPAALSREVDASQVARLWCEKHVSQSSDRTTTDTSYSLNATLKDGRVVRFVKDFARRHRPSSASSRVTSASRIGRRPARSEGQARSVASALGGSPRASAFAAGRCAAAASARPALPWHPRCGDGVNPPPGQHAEAARRASAAGGVRQAPLSTSGGEEGRLGVNRGGV